MTRDAADADAVAIEHLLWSRERGCSPADVIASVGVAWPSPRPPPWHDAQFVLAIRWHQMQRSRPKLSELSGVEATTDGMPNC